jgi:hypothetical protein
MTQDEDAGDDEVRFLNVELTGERAAPEPSGIVQHTRAVGLAMRVREGKLTETHLELEGAQVLWEDIKLLSIGQIHHSLGSMDPPKTMVRQMFGKIIGKDDKAERKGKSHQESFLFDIYTASSDAPFRLDSVNLNYRSFLGSDQQFISMHNFFRLVVRIARGASQARVNEAAYYFLFRKRDQIRPVGAIYDFELECQNDLRNRLEQLRKTSEMDLSRDNYADEWTDSQNEA